MLHLKSHHTYHSGSHGVHLKPVASEDDELIQAIEDSHEETWQLGDPDAGALGQFWSNVEEDIAKDPEWFRFADDDA